MYPMEVGPFLVSEPIAAGGMARIHLAATRGEDSRVYALKGLHESAEEEPLHRDMLLDEAAIVLRVRHPNVVRTIGVATRDERLFVVMEYVEGISLDRLVRERLPGALPPRVVVAILAGALRGLHAAHEARGERGEPLGVVHRDVSPQNVLVGADGVARIADFGCAKAAGRVQSTRRGEIKGKLLYMAPEQISGARIDRRLDVYAAGIVLWEALTAQPMFDADTPAAMLAATLEGCTIRPSDLAPNIPSALDDVVFRAMRPSPLERFTTAIEMAEALEAAVEPAGAGELACWVRALGAPALRHQARVRFALQMRAASCAPSRVVTARVARRTSLVPVVFGGVCYLAAMLLAAAFPFLR